jgi:hypothetical protein
VCESASVSEMLGLSWLTRYGNGTGGVPIVASNVVLAAPVMVRAAAPSELRMPLARRSAPRLVASEAIDCDLPLRSSEPTSAFRPLPNTSAVDVGNALSMPRRTRPWKMSSPTLNWLLMTVAPV